MTLTRIVINTFLVTVLVCRAALAQCTPHWIPEGNMEANAIPGINVLASVVLPSGDLLLGGSIPGGRNGVNWNHIVRYRPSTREFFPCGGGVALASGQSGASVTALAMDASGEVYVGGFFARAGGVAAINIARYNPTTQVWAALAAGGPEGVVRAISISSGGAVAVAGDFLGIPSSPLAGPVVVYNPPFQLWEQIGPGLFNLFGPGRADRVVWASTGDIYAYLNGYSDFPPVASELQRYNPIAGTWTRITSLPPGSHDIVGLPNGDLAVSAPSSFTDPFGVQRYSRASGTLFPLGAPGSVSCDRLALAPDGTLVGTGYTGGTSAVVRYSFASGAWTSLTSGGLTGDLSSSPLAITPMGNIFLSTTTYVAGIVSPNSIQRYFALQGVWEVPIGTQQPAVVMLTLPSGDVIVGGDITQAGGIAVGNIARYRPSDSSWSSMGGVGVNGTVKSLALLPSGDVLVGGRFTTASGVAASRVARYSPTTDAWSSAGSGVSGGLGFIEANAMVVLPSGEVVVGGHFSAPGRNIAKYNPATNAWSSIGSLGAAAGAAAIGQHVNALSVAPGGDVYVGGMFDRSPATVTAGNVARYVPSTNSWTSLGVGTDGEVVAIAPSPSTGTVFFAGSFAVVNDSLQAFYVARWTPATSSWSAAGQGPVSSVYAMATLASGQIIVGGSFQQLQDGGYASGLARLNPTTLAWSTDLGMNLNFNPVPSASCFAATPDGGFYLGGQFVEVFRYAPPEPLSSARAINFAHFGCPACRADFNNSGTITVQDIFDFLGAWFAASPSADFNHVNGITVQDIFDFLGAWFAGC